MASISPIKTILQIERSISRAQRDFKSANIAETRAVVEICKRELDLLKMDITSSSPQIRDRYAALHNSLEGLSIRLRIAESNQPASAIVRQKTLKEIRAPEWHTSTSVRRSIAWTVLDILSILPPLNNRGDAAWKNGPWVDLTGDGLVLDFGKNGIPERHAKKLYQALIKEEGYPEDKVMMADNKILIEHPHAFLFLSENCKLEALHIWELIVSCYTDPAYIEQNIFPEEDFLKVVDMFKKLCASGKIEREDELVREIDSWEIGIAKARRKAAEMRGVAAKDLPLIPPSENPTAEEIQQAAELARRYAREFRSFKIPMNGDIMLGNIEKVLLTYDVPTLEKLSGEFPDLLEKMQRYESLKYTAQYDETGNKQRELETLTKQLEGTLLFRLKGLHSLFIHTFCDGSVVKCGRDSRNRELLTDPHFVDYLKNPEYLLAILAHKALMKKRGIGEHDDLNQQFTELAGMLMYGLRDQHPVVLETMPVNRTFALASKGRIRHLVEYVRRKHSENTFGPILQALQAVHKQIVGKPCTDVHNSPLDQPYNIRQWPEYGQVYEKIMKAIAAREPDTFLENAGGTTFDRFVLEFRSGLNTLFKIMGKDMKTMTLDEVVESILSSHEILDQHVAHLFYDALHMLASFKDNGAPFIDLKDGKHTTPQELLQALFHRLSTPWKSDYSLAAEQFYVRLMLIVDKLQKQGLL